MAKEIVIWCEIHLRKGDQRVTATEEEVTLSGKQYTIDVCPECRKEHLQPLEELLAEYGEPVSKTAAKKSRATGSTPKSTKYIPDERGVFVCPEGGCHREFNSAQGIGRHMVSHN